MKRHETIDGNMLQTQTSCDDTGAPTGIDQMRGTDNAAARLHFPRMMLSSYGEHILPGHERRPCSTCGVDEGVLESWPVELPTASFRPKDELRIVEHRGAPRRCNAIRSKMTTILKDGSRANSFEHGSRLGRQRLSDFPSRLRGAVYQRRG